MTTVITPVEFHNLGGYDAHWFIRELGKKTKDISIITKTKKTTSAPQLK